VQRRLVDNIQKAQSMGAMVMKLEDADVAGALRRFAREHGVALVILGASRRTWWHRLSRRSVVDAMIAEPGGLDVLVVDSDRDDPAAETT
jgi:two-component system sensor histidine kinase KdpD